MALVLNQNHFRWRHDDGTETTATWLAATDTAPTTIYPDTVYRLRLSLLETGGTKLSKSPVSLYVSKNGSAYSLLPTAVDQTVRGVIGGLVQGADTTQQISTGTFTTKNEGCADGTATVTGTIESNQVAEFEWSIAFPYDYVGSGDVFAFRAYVNGSPITTYTFTPSITISKPVYRRFEITGYRWRRDDGSEQTATWAAPANSQIYSMVSSRKRLRLVVKEKYGQVGVYPNWQNFQVTLEAGSLTHPWDQVTQTSAHTKIANSANLGAGSDTTQQLGVGSFVGYNGQFDGVDSITPALWATNESIPAGYEWEVEVPIDFTGLDVSNGVYFDYRLASTLGAGTAKPFDTAASARANVGPWPVSGAVAAQSSANGTVYLRQAVVGSISAQSSVAGTISQRRKMVGSINATSSVSGTISARRKMVGAIQAAASLTGAITLTAAMAGAVNVTSNVSGDLKATYQLQGEISAQSTVAGDLLRIGPTWSLEGHIEEQSDVFGESMYPVPQWTLVKQWTGRSYGDSMGYDADRQFLAMGWTPNEDVTLAGIQVWLSQEDKLPPFTAISGGIWLDDGTGKPDPWNEVLFSTMTERRADKIADGTQNTGGGLYTFDFGLYDPGKPRVEAGKKYFIILYPQFGGTSPENAIWWQGDGSFDRRNERWHGDDTGEVWSRTFGGTRFIKIFAAPNQVHSLEGHVAAISTVEGSLYIPKTYYVRADGTSSKNGATNPNSSSTSMSPATFAASTFLPKETIVWSAKGGDYEQTTFSNASSGDSSYQIHMRGEFGGAGRPWISSGEEVSGGIWTKVPGFDRWWTPIGATFSIRNVVADGVDLGDNGGGPPTQPGRWLHNLGEGRLYMGGATSPAIQFSKIWVQRDEGVIFDLTGSNWLIEDLYFAMGYRTALTDAGAIDLNGGSNITLNKIGGVGHGCLAIDASGVVPLSAEEIHFKGGWAGIDISNAENPSGHILERSSFLEMYGTAVKLENGSVKIGQTVDAVRTGAFEKNFSLANMHLASISRCWMAPQYHPIENQWSANIPNGGVSIVGSVTGTIVRNCRIDGHAQLLGGIVGLDPFGNNQVTFIHNLVDGCQTGAWIWDSGTSETEIFFFNNTVIDSVNGILSVSGSHFRLWFHNNITYGVSLLDDPIGGMIWEGTAEQGNGLISFAYNTYRDKKALTFYYKGLGGGPISFGQWCSFVGEYQSYERNPNLENYSAGEYWLASGSAEIGSGRIISGDSSDDRVYALVPDTGWTSVNVADQNRYLAPGWSRGAYVGDLYLLGSIDAQSSLYGDLRVYRDALALEGHIAAQSSLIGNLTILPSGVALPLKGAINAKSNVSGDLFAPTKWSLEGHVTAKSYLDGDLYTPTRHYLAGAISAQSSLSGLLEQKYLHHLSGAIEAQSALSADLMAIRQLEGSIDAQSSVSGDLTMVEALWDLEGHIAAQSALSGDLHVHSPLEGHIAAQSSLSGELAVRHSLAGAIAAQATVSGELVSTRKLEGHIAAQSTVSGALGRIHPLAGAINAQSTVSGDLTQIDAVWELEGHVAAKTTLAGNLIVQQTLSIDDALHGHAADNLAITQHHVLAIDDTAHGHTADPADPVENIDLVIDDALHGHTADEPTIAVTHHLEIDDGFHVQFVDNLDLVEGITLSIDDAAHGHSADGLDLDQAHVLAINDAAHYHLADPLALGGTGYLGINSALHGHTADNIGLTQAHDLVIDDADHGHQADALAISVHSFLEIDDADHGHSADSLALSQDHALGIDDALHGHAADEPTLAVTSFLAIDDTVHGHASDNLDLIENIDLVIDGALHGHSADGLALVAHHMLEIDSALHGHAADNLDLTQGITLVIDGATHAHDADGLTLEEKSLLTIQDAFHLHLADEVPLVGNIPLVVDNAVHSHTADAIALQQTHVLEIDDCSHLHHADNLPISTVGILGIASAKHGHTADAVTLGQAHSLSIADATHGHASDEPTLAEKSYLQIDSAAHSHAADPLDLGQNYILEIDDCSHAHAGDPCNLTTTPILEIADAVHMHWAGIVSLIQDHTLAIADADHEVTSDNLEVAQVHALAIDDSLHGHTADEVAIEHHHFLEIDDCVHSHAADALPVIPQNSVLQIDDATHAVTSDEIPIVVGFYLEIDDALHGHAADGLVFTQQHILAIEDAIHEVAADELILDTPWYQTQRASALVGDDCITATIDEDCINVSVYPNEEDCT